MEQDEDREKRPDHVGTTAQGRPRSYFKCNDTAVVIFCLLCGDWIGGRENRKQKAIWETTAGIPAQVILAVAMKRC